MKHKKKEISLEDLTVRLKIEADNRGVTRQSECRRVKEEKTLQQKQKEEFLTKEKSS